MRSQASSVAEYLAELPDDRRAAVAKVREVVLKHKPEGVVEEFSGGMIQFVVPHSVYPPGYHCNPKQPLPYAALASQKQYMALYLMCLYSTESLQQWLAAEFKSRGKKLDMGKCCLRFKKLDDLPLDVVGQLFRRITVPDYIQAYEKAIPPSKRK